MAAPTDGTLMPAIAAACCWLCTMMRLMCSAASWRMVSCGKFGCLFRNCASRFRSCCCMSGIWLGGIVWPRGEPPIMRGIVKPAPGDVAKPAPFMLKEAITACALAMKFCWLILPFTRFRMPLGEP